MAAQKYGTAPVMGREINSNVDKGGRVTANNDDWWRFGKWYDEQSEVGSQKLKQGRVAIVLARRGTSKRTQGLLFGRMADWKMRQG